MKWCLNRSDIAKTTLELKKMTGTSKSCYNYKPMRPSEILSSEKHVTKIIQVLKGKYINPFDVGLEELYNLSSGEMVDDTFATKILSVRKDGEEIRDDFVKCRINEKSKKFHDRLSREEVHTFKTYSTSTIQCQHFQNTIEVNRDIIGTLLAFSIKNERRIDLPAALVYPLSPIPLSIAHGNGKKRETPKSKLMKLLTQDSKKKDPQKDKSVKSIAKKDKSYVIDLIAAIRTKTRLPDNYEKFIWSFINDLPKGYDRIDIVADTYRPNSIKNAERDERGKGSKLITTKSLL